MGKLKFLLIMLLVNLISSQEKDLNKEMFKTIRLANNSYTDSLNNINYLKPLSILLKNQNSIVNASKYNSTYPQFLNTSYSYLHLTDSIQYDNDSNSGDDNYKDAVSYIEKVSTNYQVVMLNESHHKIYHRIFAESLLIPLYNNGYRYLAIEALDWGDTSINSRKYPISTSGFYVREPYFGNFVRRALEIGFTLLPYEEKDFTLDTNGREEGQSKNLIAFVNKNPKAKLFVYAGYSHINENNKNNSIKWMAERFKEATKIDPLTINQTNFNFKNTIKNNVIYKNQKNLGDINNMYDLFVLNPKDQKKSQKELGRKKIKLKINNKHFSEKPLVLQAYIYDEYIIEKNKAIPFDQKGILNFTNNIYLYLDSEREYFLCLKDENNNIIASKIINRQFSREICLD